MTAKTIKGLSVDADALRTLAGELQAAADKLGALDPGILTADTRSRSPELIAARLRQIATWADKQPESGSLSAWDRTMMHGGAVQRAQTRLDNARRELASAERAFDLLRTSAPS